MNPRCVVFGIGNESRGDDALGPQLLERFKNAIKEEPFFDDFTFISDFQLQIEHSLDLEQQDIAIFIDAALPPVMLENEAFSFKLIQASKSRSGMTHSLSPSELMGIAEDFFKSKIETQSSINLLPKAYLLCIRGYQFELGTEITRKADENSKQAFTSLIDWVGKEFSLKKRNQCA